MSGFKGEGFRVTPSVKHSPARPVVKTGFWRWVYRRLTCPHYWVWQRNYHGDCITLSGGKRSYWKCHNCGATQERETLGP